MNNFISFIADILGILSFLVGIGTFFTTLRIRKKMIMHVAKSDYRQEIDTQVKNLRSYYETIIKDNIYTESLLIKLEMELDDLIIAYDAILPKDLTSKMKKLKAHISGKCLKDLNDKQFKIDCAKQIHSIASKLAKEKKII